MKKFLFLSLIFSAIISTATYAQGGGGTIPPAANSTAMLEQMKKVAPQMAEKTGLTQAQAEKVIELNFEMRQAAGALRDLPEADRMKKIGDLKAAKEKKMSELLTAEQIKAVATFYEEWGKQQQQQQKSGN